jgi:hypothetical protein
MPTLTSLIIPSFLIALTLLILNNSPAGLLIEYLNPFESLYMIICIIWGMLHTPSLQVPLIQGRAIRGPVFRGPWSFFVVPIS